MISKIKNMNIAITNKCNLKCIMCDIWKEKPKIDLSINNVKKIFQSKVLDRNLDIALTGGEPFLHEKLPGITKIILKNNRHSLKVISTNGVLTEEILKYLNRFKTLLPEDFSLHVSLDGINLNDRQRGESLEKIIKTIKCIKDNYPDINIKIKFTITPTNYTDLIPTNRFCKENNLDFRIKLVEYAENYTNKPEKKDLKFSDTAKKKIVYDLVEIYKEKIKSDKKNAEFIKDTIKLLLNKLTPFLCKTPCERIFVMPEGKVYSCIHFTEIGNLNKKSIDEIWNSEKANFIRNYIKQNKCNKCVSYHGLGIVDEYHDKSPKNHRA